MSSRSKTAYMNDELDAEQTSSGNSSLSHASKSQVSGESSTGEEVVHEVIGTGESADTETYGAGEETTEAEEAANHKSISSPPISRTSTPAPDEGEGGGSDEATDAESDFETVAGWDESNLTESSGEEALLEAYYADAEATEDGQEFFGLIAAAFVPIVKAVLPSLAGTAIKQGVSSLTSRHRRLLGRLSKLGISPKKRRETGEEFDGSVEFDEAALSELEQHLETLEVVIGQDDRVRITNTQATPWKRICHLKIKTATGKFYLGTGFFVGPRTIITAGHCVYIHSQGGWAQEITVTPGRNGTAAPFKSFTATSFRSVQGWVANKSRNYDYGAIILPKDAAIPSEIGAFGFASYSNQSLLNKKLNTAGYPGDKPGGTMWFHGRKAKAVNARTITYDIDTAGGQSGSAVWVRGNNGTRIVVGIHTNGSLRGNSATRITKSVFDNLKRWRTEGGRS